jgi:hypothetical protein
MSTEECTIALLAIQAQIANCGPSFVIRATLRAKARELAARFVDENWADEEDGREHPALRDSVEMSLERVDHVPF